MKSPDEIKKGLECCSEDVCKSCPYEQDCYTTDGFSALAADALDLIQQLQEEVSKYEEGYDALTKIIKRLEAERDAAVKSLRGRCFECKHNKTSVCLICSKDKELKYWQWRGVQKEG